MALTEPAVFRADQIELSDFATPGFCNNPLAVSGEAATGRTGRGATVQPGKVMLSRELSELRRVSLLDRDISLVNKVKLFVDIFLSWVRGSPTLQQKNYIATLHQKVTGETLSETQANTLFNKGIIQAPVNTDDAYALTIMVQFGLARFKPSNDNVLKVKLIRPDSNESLEQATSELLNQQRQEKLGLQAHDILKVKFPDLDEQCHKALVYECMENAAGKVIESLVTKPVCLENIFNKILEFNYWLSIRYVLNRKVALQADDAPNEFDEIFEHGRNIKRIIGESDIDPFLSRAALQILETELSDDASQAARRVKASAPLLILWLVDRMQMAPARERCSHEEAEQIKQALELL